jgi:hypothetical protein
MIVALHFIFVLFVVLTPFLGINYFLLLHAITVPFVMAHWYTNNNNCALTLIEHKIRQNLYGQIPDPNDCFTYRLIAPVYDFRQNNDDMSVIIYIFTISLWIYTLIRLYKNYKDGKLSKPADLFLY